MALNTFATLKSSIADWLDRDDLTSVIPDFISLAEHQMERVVRHYKMVERSSGELDSRYSALPADWLETIRFGITSGDTFRLEMTSLDDLILRREKNNDTAARPRYFAHIGDQMELFPTPDDTYTTELIYYQKIPALSDSQTTNWLLDAAPDAYLYGSLLQAAPYLSDDERIPVWNGLYNASVQSLNNASDQTKNSTSSLRMKITAY